MKEYSNSLNIYTNKLSLNELRIYLWQMLMAQLNAFENCGFLHMDIHLGNILIDNSNDSIKELSYTFDNINYITCLPKNKIIDISDFDKSVLMNNKIMDLPLFNRDYMLYHNIIRTLKSSIDLLKKHKDKMILNDAIDKAQLDISAGYERNEISSLNRLYNEIKHFDIQSENSYKFYITDVIHNQINMINSIWYNIYGEYMFKHYKDMSLYLSSKKGNDNIKTKINLL